MSTATTTPQQVADLEREALALGKAHRMVREDLGYYSDLVGDAAEIGDPLLVTYAEESVAMSLAADLIARDMLEGWPAARRFVENQLDRIGRLETRGYWVDG